MPRGRVAGMTLLAGLFSLGCAAEEAGPVPAPGASATGDSALSTRDVAKKRFDETPPPGASRKR